MAASTEWSPVAPALPTSSTEDLFDGDILGDELMDIYNAAVVGGGDGGMYLTTRENLRFIICFRRKTN